MTKSMKCLYNKIDKQTKEDNSIIGKTYNIVYNLPWNYNFKTKLVKKSTYLKLTYTYIYFLTMFNTPS